MSFQSVVFEGGDQVGKGDATQKFVNTLSQENICVNRVAFPMYATPIGSTIRKFLKEGIGDIKSLEKIAGTRREIEVRMLVYALNRLEALESILRHPDCSVGVFLLDRSPYSHALTIAYGLKGFKDSKITNEDVKELLQFTLDSEDLLIKTLNLKNCVVRLTADNGDQGWKASRVDDADLLESKDVQETADTLYREFNHMVGDGWKQIFTKTDGEWRDREDIYKDIRSFVDSRLDLTKGGGKLSKTIDIVDIANDIYGVDVSDRVDKYYNSIATCDKATMYKEALDIADSVNLHSSEITFENEEVINNFRKILDAYPEIFDLFEHYLGEYFVENLKVCIYE